MHLTGTHEEDWSSIGTMHTILAKLDGKSLAMCSTVCKHWHVHASDMRLWKARLAKDFDVLGSTNPEGVLCATPREAYAGWMHEYNLYGPVSRRVRKAWATIRAVFQRDLAPVLATLRPGASEEALDQVERESGCKIPPTLRMLWRVHNGQNIPSPGGQNLFYGVFGSYAFYNHAISMYMVPVGMGNSRCLARSPQALADRIIMVDEIETPYLQGIAGPIWMCRTPTGPDPPLLHWFESYAEALHTGMFRVTPIVEQLPLLGMSLFPQAAPHMQTATTHGVVVRVSTVSEPEVGALRQAVVAYAVRFSMLSDDAWPAGLPRMASCQLRARRWRIMDDLGEVVDTVEGEGVVGRYPLLFPGAPEIEYRSCSQPVGEGGHMEGEFEFVPGTLNTPLGEPFYVMCPRFSLKARNILF